MDRPSGPVGCAPVGELGRNLGEDLARAVGQEEMPASAAVEAVLGHAVRMRASDVHLDPQPDGLLVRFRIDGVLHDVATVPGAWAGRVVARIKVLANLLTYREDVPQEGRVTSYPHPESPGLRVSVYPSLHGEKTTIRVFHRETEALELDQLGFDSSTLSRIRQVLYRPQGMLVLTGPSGSGKTTTIHALLRALDRHFRRTRSIVTVEDPIEVPLAGVVQTQVNRLTGLDFQGALRTLLRHDPEVIVIGEIRDRETAEIAIEAGLTGHLIISTIHSGRAVGVFNRLLDMGIEPYLITSALSAVLAQRLVRRLCAACAGNPGRPCAECHDTGYRGRTAIHEFVPVEGPIRTAILQRADAGVYAQAMKELSCETLLECARGVVERQATRAEEVARVLG